MKILHISRTMGQGGAEKVVFQLCKDCNEADHYVASCGGEYVIELEKIGTKHIEIPDIDGKKPYQMLQTLLILRRTIKENGIDVVHTHHRMAAFYARLLQMTNSKLKHVYTAHNVFYGKKGLMRFALKKASIVACGETVKKNLEDEYGIPHKDIEVIYNSVELSPLKEIHIDSIEEKKKQGAYLIGSIGRITEQKGFDIFIKAIARCKNEIANIVGVIIGDGEDREKIRQLAREEGIEDNVLFLGYQKEVLSLITQMEFIVLASRWEGFPLTPIETFSVGKTIIVSDIPNNLEIVEPMVNGMSFTKDDEMDLYKRIVELCADSEMLKKLEKNAALTYKKKFDYEHFLDSYQAVWDRMNI